MNSMMRQFAMKSVKIALLSLILFGCDSTFSGPPLSGSVQQRRLAIVSQPAEVLISNDLEHVAVIDQHGRKQRLTVDGKIGPESDTIQFVKHDGPLFSRRGVPVLYARADCGRWRFVSNGVPGPECDAWTNLTSGGTDRTTIAYTAVEVSRKAFVAIDGQPGPTYADVSCPTISPDGTRIAYVAYTRQGPHRKYILVIDGRAGPEYDEIAIPSSGIWSVFSPDSTRTAFVARFGLGWRVVTDGKPGPAYDEIAPDSLSFSRDRRPRRLRSQNRVAVVRGPQWPAWATARRDRPGPDPFPCLCERYRFHSLGRLEVAGHRRRSAPAPVMRLPT